MPASSRPNYHFLMLALAVIVVCLGLNAVFAAVETAFVTIGRPRLRQMARNGDSAAPGILQLRETPERTLSVIQIGTTVVGAVAATVGGVGAVQTWAPWLESHWHLHHALADFIAVVAFVLPLTYLQVVMSELVPKTLALRDPLVIVKKALRWLQLFDRLLSPVVSFLSKSTRWILRWAPKKKPAPPTEAEFNLEELSSPAREYVLNLVDLEHKKIRDVRIPWDQVDTVQSTDAELDVERVALRTRHTRIPVVNESGKISGVLNTKEFMVFLATGGGDWTTLIRPAVIVEENMPILFALVKMQERHSMLSITCFNGVRSGIVTVEDILEEVIGDLYDEDDDGRLKRVLTSTARLKQIRTETPETPRGQPLS